MPHHPGSPEDGSDSRQQRRLSEQSDRDLIRQPRNGAKKSWARSARLSKEHSIELEDAVIVTRNDDGKVKLHQSRNSLPPVPPEERCGAA